MKVRDRAEIPEDDDRATQRENENRAAHARNMQDNNERRARQEANDRADQARRDQEPQHRETLNALKSDNTRPAKKEGVGFLGLVAAGAAGTSIMSFEEAFAWAVIIAALLFWNRSEKPDV